VLVLSRRWSSWWWDVLLVGGFAGFTAIVAAGWTDELDYAVRDWSRSHRPDALYWPARLFNYLGQGWLLMYIITGGLTLYLVISRRNLRYLAPAVAGYLLTSLITGPVKIWTARTAPNADIKDGVTDPVAFFYDGPVRAESYPSGHVVNAIVWWGVIVLLIRQIPALSARLSARGERWLRIGAPIIVICTTTYLGFHWLTDDVGAVLLGVFTWRLFLRLPWSRILPAP